MAKQPLKLTVKIPGFQTDKKAWQRAINGAVAEARSAMAAPVAYGEDDKLEVEICFYLQGHKLTILDVDNRVKAVLDALQGFSGKKGKSGLVPIIPNDNQIYRVIAEKRMPPKGNLDSLSVVTVRGYTNDSRTKKTPREHRKHA